MATTRPMLSYYGSKWRLARHYPPPLYNKIIEPFAGGAGYSLRWHDLDVLLLDIDPHVVMAWDYLIRAKPSEIHALPLLQPGQHRDEIVWPCEEARIFVGFWLSPGSSYSCNKLTSRGEGGRKGWCEETREQLAYQSSLVSHWEVLHGGYEDAPCGQATRFVDAPYWGRAGSYYRFGSDQIDYSELGTWCCAQEGQTIVCEAVGAAWLPFEPLGKQWGSQGESEEAICLLGDRAGQVGLFDDMHTWR